MAEQVGLDYTASFLSPPMTDAALAFEAVRCGSGLLLNYIDPGTAWSSMSLRDRASRRQAAKASRHIAGALTTDDGRDAISWMTQGFATAMAEFWRRAAVTHEHAEQLRASADASERLAHLVAQMWPVLDRHQVLREIARAEEKRFYDPFNPDAMMDLSDYASRARVTAEALALAAGDRFAEFELLIISPVLSLDLEHGHLLASDWNFTGKEWVNLLHPDPVARASVLQSIALEAS